MQSIINGTSRRGGSTLTRKEEGSTMSDDMGSAEQNVRRVVSGVSDPDGVILSSVLPLHRPQQEDK